MTTSSWPGIFKHETQTSAIVAKWSRLIALDAPRFALEAAVARFAVADFGGAVIASGLH